MESGASQVPYTTQVEKNRKKERGKRCHVDDSGTGIYKKKKKMGRKWRSINRDQDVMGRKIDTISTNKG